MLLLLLLFLSVELELFVGLLTSSEPGNERTFFDSE